jgi:hypothetical protein
MISGFAPSIANTIQSASIYTSAWRTAAPDKNTDQNTATKADASDNKAPRSSNNRAETLSPDDQHRVEEMKATDRAVRAHEAAHMAVGGNLVTSGASYSYETGPDGQRYAVAGEVGISMSKGRTPEETLVRAGQIRAAALAPSDPSPQDRAVAAAAAQMAAAARVEIAQANVEKSKADTPEDSAGTKSTTSANDSRAFSFGQAIERGLSPESAGQAVNIFA